MRKLYQPTLVAAMAIAASGTAFAQTPALARDGAALSRNQAPSVNAPVAAQALESTTAGNPLTRYAQPRATFRAPMRAPESFPELQGVIVSSNDWQGQNLMGMYSISMVPGVGNQLIALGIHCDTNSAVEIDGMFYTQRTVTQGGMTFGVALETYDAETWALVDSRDFNNDLITYYGVARDPRDGKVYGVLQPAERYDNVWGTLDFVNSDVTYLSDHSCDQYLALGFTPDGTLYGVRPLRGSNTEFGIVDKADGGFTKISNLSHRATKITSGCTDPKTGRFFLNVIGDDRESWLLEIDPKTGTELYEYQIPGGDAIRAMRVPADLNAGLDPQAPAAPQLTATASDSGAKRVELDITAPATAVNGEKLAEDMTVILKRDGKMVQTRDDVAPGAAIQMVDEPENNGRVRYTVVCENSWGTGRSVSATVYVGINAPAAPRNVQIVETDEPGCIRMTWDAVTKDADGFPVDPSRVTYVVFDQNGNIVSMGNSATEYTGRAIPADQSAFVGYGLYAVTKGGKSAIVNSKKIPVGAAAPAPYYENGTAASPNELLCDNNGGATWGKVADGKFADLASVDGDGGFYLCTGKQGGQFADLVTGKIAVGDMDNPTLSFYTFRIDGDMDDENELLVCATADGELGVLADVVIKSLPNPGWNKITLPLAGYEGKDIYLTFRGGIVNFQYLPLDDINVYTLTETNLSVGTLSAPGRVEPGAPFNVTVPVFNNGTLNVKGYDVDLELNGQVVATQTGGTLKADEMATFTFAQKLNATNGAENVYVARVRCEGDQVADDDASDPLTVELNVSRMAAPRNLAATTDEHGNLLTWEAPQPEDFEQHVVEDFENGEAWAQELDGWTIIDRDGGKVGAFSGQDGTLTIPGWRKGKDPSVWTVFDRSDTSVYDFPSSFDAHSGVKYMAVMFNQTNEPRNDDWLISPALPGTEQTVSYWAKSYSAYYPEHIRVWYSGGTLLPEGFTELKEASHLTTPSVWTRYEFKLPEGAKRFAIQCNSENEWMLSLDDVEYTRLGGAGELKVTGYNVYRDGQLIATVDQPTYLDTNCAGQHTYAVTALYEGQGEGAASNAISVDNQQVGIDGASIDAAATRWYDLRGHRVAQPGRGVFIEVRDGRARKVSL